MTSKYNPSICHIIPLLLLNVNSINVICCHCLSSGIPDPCPSIPVSSERDITEPPVPHEVTEPLTCEEKADSARSRKTIRSEKGSGDLSSQTCVDSGSNTDNPNSYTTACDDSVPETSEACSEKNKKGKTFQLRNPITGMGLGCDGVGGLKPIKPKSRRGEDGTLNDTIKHFNSKHHTLSYIHIIN